MSNSHDKKKTTTDFNLVLNKPTKNSQRIAPLINQNKKTCNVYPHIVRSPLLSKISKT